MNPRLPSHEDLDAEASGDPDNPMKDYQDTQWKPKMEK
jgi:hypothetical protein